MDKLAAKMRKIPKPIRAIVLFVAAVAILLTFTVLDARDEERTCPLHDVALKVGSVRIFYGLPDFETEYWKARTEQFPFANSTYGGGCMPKIRRIAIVRYCPVCRDAEKEWEANAQPD
jgi:hypothetical protein